MAEEFAHLDQQPLLKEGEVRSTSIGFEKMANVLGVAAKELFSKAENMAKEASATNYLQSQAMLSELASSAKIQMKEHPHMASTIAEKTAENAEIIKSGIYVNNQDRERFNLMTDEVVRDLSVTGKQVELGIANEQAKYQTLTAFQSNLDVYRNLMYLNNEKPSIDQQNLMLESIRGQISSGIISAHEGMSMYNAMMIEVSRHDEMVKRYRDDTADAHFVHSARAFSTDSLIDNSKLPADENTTQLYNANREYQSASDIEASLSQGLIVNPMAFNNIKNPISRQKLNEYKYGAADAQGMINSAGSYKKMMYRYNYLKGLSHLNSRQKGVKGRLETIINDFENGNGLDYIGENPIGARVLQEYNNKVDAITYSKGLNDSQKKSMINDAHQDLLSSVINIYEAMGVPTQLRSIFPKSQINMVKNNLFNPEGNVNTAIDAIFNTKKDALPYLANQMDKPVQAMTVMAIGGLKGKVDSRFLTELASFNKSGIDYKGKLIQSEEGGASNPITDKKIHGDLTNSTELEGYRQIFRHSPRIQGEDVNSATVEMGMNYIKGRAILANDSKILGYKEYLKDFTTNIKKMSNPLIGNNFTIDANIIPISDDQARLLSKDILEEVKEKMIEEGMTEHQIDTNFINDSFKVISSQTGHLTVVDRRGFVILDKNNNPYYDHLYLETTLTHSRERQRSKKEKENLFPKIHKIEKSMS